MLRQLLTIFAVLAGLLPSPVALAATPDEAKEMAERAAQYLRDHGQDAAFAAIDDPQGPFRKGDLYVFVHDTTGLVRAHGGYATLIGRNTIRLTDVDGKPFVKEIVSIQDRGWVDYKWQNPETKQLSEKTVYVIHIGDLLVCAGAYK